MAESVLERRTYDTGQKIFDEGQVGNQAYIIQSGRVEIVDGDKDRGGSRSSRWERVRKPSLAPSERAACSARWR